MRALIAALVLTLAIAVTASVFAVWPVVTDAPWEDDVSVPVVDRTQEIRCEAALDLRETIVRQGRYNRGNQSGLLDYEDVLRDAEREIDRFC